MMAVATKSDSLYENLWKELNKLSPGERFLSVREIMKRYEVSQLTVDKALSRLREDGYLHQMPGKGLFATEQVARFSQTTKPTLMLAVPQWLSVDVDVLERTAEAMRGEFPEHRLLVHKFNVDNTIPGELPLLEENVVGVIILPAGGGLNADDLKRFTAYPAPLVVLGRHLDEFGIPSVGADDNFAGHLGMHYLAARGHRKIGILLCEPHNPIIMERVKAILDYAELHGVKTTMIDCEIKSGEMSINKTYRKFLRVIDAGFDFTALLSISGEATQGAVNACLNRKVAIPEQLSMIAIGGEKVTETFHPALTTVGIRFEEQVRLALKMLYREITANESAHAEYIRPQIIEHGSVKVR